MREESPRNASSTPSAPPAALLEGLLSNPEMLQRIGSILGSMTAAPVSAETSASPSPAPTEQASSKDEPVTPTLAPDGLSSLLSNPALLEQLPQMLSVIKPLLASMPPPKAASSAPAPSSPEGCRDNLLHALKPFLSDHRRDAVDTILRISRLGTVFKQLK